MEEVASSVDLFFVERHYEFLVRHGVRTCAFHRRLVGCFRGVEALPLAERGAHRGSN